MTADTLPEGLEHLAREISAADLRRLVEMGLLEVPARSESSPAQPSTPEETRPTPPPATRETPATTAWTDFGELQEIQFALHDEEAEEEAPKRRFRLRDALDYLTIGGLSLALILERTVTYLRKAKSDFDRLPLAVRGAFYLALALLLLALVGVILGMQLPSLLNDHSGPVLVEALAAPYDLEERDAPPSSAEAWQLVPDVLGEFERSTEIMTASNPSSPTNQCLLGLGYDTKIVNPPACARSYGVVGTGMARYLDGRIKVDLAVARFSNEAKAGITMFELLRHVRQYGQAGDFAIGGVREVDYFYSAVRGWVSFTWRRGPWIFSLSSTRYASLETAIAAYPY